MKILVMGLPGSGKTTLAEKLFLEIVKNRPAEWVNADELRTECKDWDFSDTGRLRQAKRMTVIANAGVENGFVMVSDFVCPKKEYRELFDADITVWMDTVKESEYEDTNNLFEPPADDEYTFRVVDTEDIDKTVGTIADLVEILTEDA
jgi:adenylylsulfate kinase